MGNSASTGISTKSGTLHLVIIGLWLACVARLGSRFYGVFIQSDFVTRVLLMIVGSSIALFWFYGCYHGMFLLFDHIVKRKPAFKTTALDVDPASLPRVAILYATANDFSYEAALTCVRQEYGPHHVFLLDDSTNEAMMELVDGFQREFPDITTVVRRETRRGFKAGNLNNALSIYAREYQLFAICDADGHLPPDFLVKTVCYFLLDDKVAFVQANHRSKYHSQEKFVKDFEAAISTFWYRDQIARNRYGLVMFMGHGVIMRTDLWQRVGGFPEIVQEDTAITLRLRRAGYHGHFAQDVVCGEDFPEDFLRYRRRYYRVVQAELECFSREVLSFIRATQVGLVEKWDVLVRTLRLPTGSLVLPYVLCLSALLPRLSRGEGPTALFSWDFALMTVLASFGPCYPFMVDLWREPLRLVHLIFHAITVSYSLILLATLSLLTCILVGEAHFVVTGDAASAKRRVKGLREFLGTLPANHPAIESSEILIALLLGSLGLITGNYALLGVALALILAPLLSRFGWQNKALSLFAYLPFTLIVVSIVLGGLGFWGLKGQYLVLSGLSVLLF